MFLEISRKENEERPRIFGDFDLSQGSLTYRKTGEKVSISSATGKFDLGTLAQPITTKIDVSQISFSTKEGAASGSFKLVNLRHPKFVLATKGNIDLQEITKLVDLGPEFGMEGMVDFDIQLKGRIQNLDSIINKDIETFTGNAVLDINNTSFEIKGAPELRDISVHVDLDKRKAVFSNLQGEIAKSKTMGFGEVKDWLPFVLGQKKALDVKADLITDKLVLDNWSNSVESKKEITKLIPDFITYQGRIEVKEFENKDLLLKNIKSKVFLKADKLVLKSLTLEGFSGGLKAGLIWTENQHGHQFSGSVITQGVKIDELLESFNNFGQKELTANQIKGGFNSKLDFSFTTDKNLKVNESSIYLDGDVMVLNGELIEYKLLYNIPKELESHKIIKLFVNMELFEQRLHHIKFDTMSNHVTIKNKTMTIPHMVIHSSAMSIAIQGTHTFDNNVDYYVNFSLRHVLGKDEPIKDEYGYIRDDEKGNRMIYLHLYSENGEIEVDLDKFGKDKGLIESTNREFDEVKSVLKEELGFYKKDSSVVVNVEEDTFEYSVDLGEYGDSAIADSTVVSDTVKQDSSLFKKLIKGKKKKKTSDEDFEEWDFDDDDF